MIVARIFISTLCLLILFGLSQSATPMCKYESNNGYYSCTVQNDLNITSKEAAFIDRARGSHYVGRYDDYVHGFSANNKTIQHFPRGLGNVFPKLYFIQITNDRIKEIHQDDLNFWRLDYLDLSYNEIEILEDGLFSNNKNLEFINFQHNRIFHVGLNIFDHLDKIIKMYFKDNKCVNGNAETAEMSKELIASLKSTCESEDFLTFDMELKQFNEYNGTCEDFKLQIEELDNRFQNSDISDSVYVKELIQDTSNKQNCTVTNDECPSAVQNQSISDELKKMVQQSFEGFSDQIKKIKKADEEKFVDVKKSVGDLKDVLREITVNATIKNSALEASVEVLKEKLDEMQGANAEATYRTNIFMLIMLCIIGIALIAFLIGLIRKKFNKNAKLDQEKQENRAVENGNE